MALGLTLLSYDFNAIQGSISMSIPSPRAM